MDGGSLLAGWVDCLTSLVAKSRIDGDTSVIEPCLSWSNCFSTKRYMACIAPSRADVTVEEVDVGCVARVPEVDRELERALDDVGVEPELEPDGIVLEGVRRGDGAAVCVPRGTAADAAAAARAASALAVASCS